MEKRASGIIIRCLIKKYMKAKTKIERCGFCGAYLRGGEYMTQEEVEWIDAEKLDGVPLGYCKHQLCSTGDFSEID